MEWRVKVVGPAAGECLNLLLGSDTANVQISDHVAIILQSPNDTSNADTLVVAYSNSNNTDEELQDTIAQCQLPDAPFTLLLMYLRSSGTTDMQFTHKFLQVLNHCSPDCYMSDRTVCDSNDQVSARAELARHITYADLS